MDEAVIRQIEKEGAEALLDIGVSVPLKALRLPFRKEPFVLRITMKRPCMGGQIRIARTYLKMGVTSDEMRKFSKEDEMRFIADHGGEVSLMIAYTICRGWWSRHLLVRFVSWIIRNWMENDYLLASMKKFVGLMGTDPFIPIIRSAEVANPMKLRLSQKRKGS